MVELLGLDHLEFIQQLLTNRCAIVDTLLNDTSSTSKYID